MSSIKIIENHTQLNDQGCQFFLSSNENIVTRMTSSEVRWLSLRTSKNEFISDSQVLAYEYINKIAENYKESDWDKINMKILLNSNPIGKQDEHIKTLIMCGADVRYLNEKTPIKIILQKNKLYITIAPSIERVVNSGVLYTGRTINDPLIDYYKEEFDQKFAKARQVILVNEQLRFRKRNIKEILQMIKNIEMQDWFILILGTVLGGLVGIFVS